MNKISKMEEVLFNLKKNIYLKKKYKNAKAFKMINKINLHTKMIK
jgi:hypothetical protein